MVDHAANQIKMISNDRVFVLKLIEGTKPLSTTGTPDKRLFTGENRLHAIRDPQTSFWSVRYDSGIVPKPLEQSFTTFQKCRDFVTAYFKRRNIDVTDIVENFDG